MRIRTLSLLALLGLLSVSMGCATSGSSEEALPEVSAPTPIPPLGERGDARLQNLFNASCDSTYLIYREGESDHPIEARSDAAWQQRRVDLQECARLVAEENDTVEELEALGFDNGQARAVEAAVAGGYYQKLIEKRIRYEQERARDLATNH